MILGLVKPDSGVVTLFGKDSTTLTGNFLNVNVEN